MLDWSDGQKYALRALGYRRWLLRSSLAGQLREPGQGAAPLRKPALAPEELAQRESARAALAAVLAPPAAAPVAPVAKTEGRGELPPALEKSAPVPAGEGQLLRWDFGQLLVDDNYCLISSENLRYRWLLPPPIWEEGQWRLLRRAEADLLLRALINSGEADEGRGLEPFLQAALPAPLPTAQPLDLSAKTVALGNFVAKNLGQEQRLRVYYLSHPQFVLEQRAKRQLWQQIKGLKDY